MEYYPTWRQAQFQAIFLTVLAAVCLGIVMVVFNLGGDPVRQPTDQPRQPPPWTFQDKPAAKQEALGSDEDVEQAGARGAAQQRQRMVERQMRARDITNQRVLEAMNKVPRHQFVPAALQPYAYEDRPLPIGHQQTISQPYVVALMTQLAAPTQQARALDVGTGSGYQAAVLAELVGQVYSIEIVEPLAAAASQRLKSLGYKNVEVRHGDGYRGWKEQAPFDVIIVAAAPDHVPQPLVDQLAPGGRLVIPVGGRFGQNLLVMEKRADGTIHQRKVAPVAFVPMTGEADR